MRILRTLPPSLRALLAHRVRSLLAATGVAIGIAAVFLTSAIGQGASSEMEKSLGAMGTRMLVIRPETVKKTVARKELQGLQSTLKLEDYQAIRELPLVSDAAPVVEGARKIKVGQAVVSTKVLGTTSAFFRIRDFQVARGRLFDGEEDEGHARLVVVLGGELAASLFPQEDPAGQEIRIGQVRFEVVGTLVAKGVAADGADADNQAFVPVGTAMRRLFDLRSLGAIFVRTSDPGGLDLLKANIQELLRERHARRDRPDDFAVQDQRRFISAEERTLRPLGWLTSGLAVLALLVGGTGILALMLLSVRERTPEIGLRMAVGARPRDVLLQFLAEALVLALLGGVAGIAIGAAGTRILAWATHWPLRVSVGAIAVSFATSAAIGLLFGAIPARKAALLPPVQALSLE
jgi:putative ABC transport system permease protein